MSESAGAPAANRPPSPDASALLDSAGTTNAAAIGAGTPTVNRRRKYSASANFGSPRSAYVFLLPWFGGLLLLTIGPLVASFVLSFSNFDLLKAPQFIGLSNYTELLGDSRFHQALEVTFTYVIITVPLQLAFALLLAVLLNQTARGIGLLRGAYYLPSLFGGSVAIALVWRQMFDGDGVVNTFLSFFGITGISWISNPATALYTLVVLHIWQFGAPMVIFLAALRQVPADLLDAAAVDGAGAWLRFWRVVFPLITPIIFFNLVLQIIQAFQAFTPAFIISQGTGGPSDSTLFYTLYLYQEGFSALRMGYASAMAWILLVIIAIFTAANFGLARFWVFDGDGRR